MRTTITVQPLSEPVGRERELVVAWDKDSNVAQVGYGFPDSGEAELATLNAGQLDDLIAALQAARAGIGPQLPAKPVMRGGVIISSTPAPGQSAATFIEQVSARQGVR